MAIIKTLDFLTIDTSAIRLPRYAQIVEYSECLFFGVEDANAPNYACRQFWSKPERDSVARYLAEAQEELEKILTFKVQKTWVSDKLFWSATGRYHSRWCNVIEVGVRATTVLESGATVDHTTDPAIIGPIATTVTDTDEIIICHPGTDVEIVPSDITISGGFVTIEIPRCRMVKQSDQNNNPLVPMSYDITGPTGVFLQTVDVIRVYNDSGTQATITYTDGSTSEVGLQIINPTTGFFSLTALNTTGCPTFPVCAGSQIGLCPAYVTLHYKCGVDMTKQQEDTIVRLAHSKMPVEPCGCDITQRLWKRDRNVPEVMTRERINCPFGMSDGAWIAWRFAQDMRIVRSLGSLM